MKNMHGLSSRRSGFTLIELLTVVAIIALLIGILAPSLTKARDVAKNTATRAALASMEKGNEMFNTDFKQYPESASHVRLGANYQPKQDPLFNMGISPDVSNPRLYGAHWLALALVGPDTNGIDSNGYLMRDKRTLTVTAGKKVEPVADNSGTGVDFTDVGSKLDRKGAYLDAGKILSLDTDASRIPGATSGPQTARFILLDSYNGPILYYRANSRAELPFSNTGVSANNALGIYNQQDNIGITGGASVTGWDFAGVGSFTHGLSDFGPTNYVPNTVENDPTMTGVKGKTFIDYLHQHSAHASGNVVKPVKNETFVLIAPGKDGLYGTTDDINNFSD